MKKIRAILLLLASLSPASVFAHPGHGHFDGYSLWHYVTSEEHVLQLMVLTLIAIAVIYFIKRWNPIEIKSRKK